jgi:RNA polymerase sigma factor (sigma-70 family)
LEQTADTVAMEAAALPARRRRPLRGRLLRGTSDEALVARVRAGDDAAFEGIYDRYHRGLLAFCRHMLGSREEAEDAVQHSFLAAYRNLRAGDHEIRLKAWLYTIARNRCLSMLRARREQVELDESRVAAPAFDGLATQVQRRDDLREMLADLERLPDDQRAALVLFELGDHSHEDIATILEVRREKVKALVFQARESLLTSRTARDMPCAEIREQLSTLTGGALRRSKLRRHVEQCQGCRAFESEVKRQRAAMVVLLPVVPTLGMKSSVLAGTVGAATGAGAAAGGSAAVGAFAGLGAKGIATKLAVTAAIATTAGGGGYVAVHEIEGSGSPASATQQRATPATPAKPSNSGSGPATRAVPATPATPAKGAAPAHAQRKGASSKDRGGASAGASGRAKGAQGAQGAAHAKRKAVVPATRRQGSRRAKVAPVKKLRARRRGTSAGKPVHSPSLGSAKRPATTPPPAATQEQQPATTAPATTTDITGSGALDGLATDPSAGSGRTQSAP